LDDWFRAHPATKSDTVRIVTRPVFNNPLNLFLLQTQGEYDHNSSRYE
jgi:hypothetical protein